MAGWGAPHPSSTGGGNATIARARLRAALAGLVALATTSIFGLVPESVVGAGSQPPGPGLEVTAGPSGPSTTGALHVVALGDSVPSGAACGCDPFPVLYGRLLAHRTGGEVTVDDEGVNGLDTAGLVAQLQQPAEAGLVSGAQIILVTIGANDFADHHDDVTSGSCGAGTDCVDDEMARMRTGLTEALDRIRVLRAGRPTTLLVTGYWNVFEDGDVAIGSAGVSGLRASVALTARVNSAIRDVARAQGAAYVDLVPAFRAGDRGITALLADDGDHPDAAGHATIARVLLRAGRPLLP